MIIGIGGFIATIKSKNPVSLGGDQCMEGKMNLTTQFFNWKLPHPVLISSGPLSTNSMSIAAAINHGAAAVVTKTISTENTSSHKGIFHYSDDILFNSEGFSLYTASQWVDRWKDLKGYPVIANIHAATPEKLANLAVDIVNAGAEVLELGLSCPTFDDEPICYNLRQLEKFCLCVRRAVSVPVIVKIVVSMSKHFNREIVQCLEDNGMDGVSLSDSLPALMGQTGGLTGSFLKPLVMRTLSEIEDSPLCKIAIGGVFSKQDVQDYIQCGATTVGVCTMVIKKGWGEFEKLVDDICEVKDMR